MELTKKFKIDEQTYTEFCLKTAGSRNYLTIALTAVAIIVISIVMKFSDKGTLASFGVGCIYAAIYAIIVIIFSNITTRSAAKRAFTKNNLKAYEVIYTFNENGIVQAVENGEPYTVEWAKVKKIVETKLAFHFYISSSQAIVAGKAGLLAKDIVTIREIAKAAVAGSKTRVKLLEGEPELIADVVNETKPIEDVVNKQAETKPVKKETKTSSAKKTTKKTKEK